MEKMVSYGLMKLSLMSMASPNFMILARRPMGLFYKSYSDLYALFDGAGFVEVRKRKKSYGYSM